MEYKIEFFFFGKEFLLGTAMTSSVLSLPLSSLVELIAVLFSFQMLAWDYVLDDEIDHFATWAQVPVFPNTMCLEWLNKLIFVMYLN